MPVKPPIIMGDLGGTHLRLGRQDAGIIQDIRTYTPSQWPSLGAAVKDYAPEAKGGTLLLSFAKKIQDGGVYHLDQAHKKGAWSFTTDDLKTICGFVDVRVLHDMHAMALSVFHNDALFETIVPTSAAQGMRVIINIGTGLGHAFINPKDKSVHDTFGGHFPPATVTQEQQEALSLLRFHADPERSFIWEEILSGRGYKALQEHTMDGDRLFCEYLGLYANTLAVSGHAFGGVYLCGGVIERIGAAGVFDAQAYQTYFRLNNVPIVDDALRACPTLRALKPYTALYGLDVYAQSLSDD